MGGLHRVHADARAMDPRVARANGLLVLTPVRDRRGASEDARGNHPAERTTRPDRDQRARLFRDAHPRMARPRGGRALAQRRGDLGRAVPTLPGTLGPQSPGPALQQRAARHGAGAFDLRRAGSLTAPARSVNEGPKAAAESSVASLLPAAVRRRRRASGTCLALDAEAQIAGDEVVPHRARELAVADLRHRKLVIDTREPHTVWTTGPFARTGRCASRITDLREHPTRHRQLPTGLVRRRARKEAETCNH